MTCRVFRGLKLGTIRNCDIEGEDGTWAGGEGEVSTRRMESVFGIGMRDLEGSVRSGDVESEGVGAGGGGDSEARRVSVNGPGVGIWQMRSRSYRCESNNNSAYG